MMVGGEIVQNIGRWLVEIVLPGLGTLLLAALWALARRYIQRIDDARIREILEELVRAAEQMFGVGEGAEKLTYVSKELKRRGLDGRLTRVDIEAAVNRTFPRFDVWPDAEGEGSSAE